MRYQLFTVAALAVACLVAEILSGCAPAERPDVDRAVVEARERINDNPLGDSIAEPVESDVAPVEATQPPQRASDSISYTPRGGEADNEPDTESTETEVTSTVQTDGSESTADIPRRELIGIGAEWCGPCVTVHAAAEGVEGVSFLDLDAQPDEVANLWTGSAHFSIDEFGRRMPPSLPSFVQLVDGKPTRWFLVPANDPHPWNAERIAYLRDYDGPAVPLATQSRPVHPQPARGLFRWFRR